ncbi:histidine phosphatase family protein [Inhella sp.]|uniref:histidine phosphatase family protein n=1 Tax=Inhella sp. TaxID=1921806 RepID=UPI0035AE6CE6
MGEKPLRLCLVRHGETDWNRAQRLQGWTDVPLNAEGRVQALAAAQELAGERFDAIYSSPLQRARATAEALAQPHGHALQLDERLRERHLGELQGLLKPEIEQRHPELARLMQQRRPSYAPPGGETLAQFRARVEAWLADLVQAHGGQTVLAVSHGGVLDLVHRLASDGDFDAPRRVTLGNAALNWFVWRQQRWWVEAMGLTEHLDQSLDERTV